MEVNTQIWRDIAEIADNESLMKQLAKYLKNEKFSRYPVYDGVLDNIIGGLYVKDVLFC